MDPTDPDLDPDRQDCDTHLPTDHAIAFQKTDAKNITSEKILCPFAVYYLRYAIRSFFTLSRISAKERDKKYSVKSPQRYKK
jgi:hypothetical protein